MSQLHYADSKCLVKHPLLCHYIMAGKNGAQEVVAMAIYYMYIGEL